MYLGAQNVIVFLSFLNTEMLLVIEILSHQTKAPYMLYFYYHNSRWSPGDTKSHAVSSPIFLHVPLGKADWFNI